ncbi:MAG: enoyl-CoA hydratase-related protein [bacterium]|nr:enoyl-CoA hydratase-related protein [bacterium]
MGYEFFQITRDEAVAVAVMNRPPVNALSAALMADLAAVLDELEGDGTVRAVLLTAGEDIRTRAAKFFCAGADIKEFGETFFGGGARDAVAGGSRIVTRLQRFPKPVVVAINGNALGGGCELVMACHVRILAAEAVLGQPEIKLGIIPGYGGTQRLPRLMGRGLALEYLLTGDNIPPELALHTGLVNHVVPLAECVDKGLAIAHKLSRQAPLALRYIIEAVNEGLDSGVDTSMAVELDRMLRVLATEDAVEGGMAFVQKRPPEFKGR